MRNVDWFSRCATAAMIFSIIAMFVAFATVAHADSPYEGSINHKYDATWRKALDKAARLSAKQNHGHPEFTRTCYAEDQTAFCATVIVYRSADGDLTFMRVIRRGEDDSLFARDVCQFNKDETLRTCVNFDNGYKSLWVEDDNGDWQRADRDDINN